jgi:hypothetical protein
VRLMQEMGVAMTPGMSMYMGHAGFFRMVFSAASPTAWPIALERLESVRCGRTGTTIAIARRYVCVCARVCLSVTHSI